METERRRQVLLGVVTLVLVTVLYYEWPRTSADASQSSKQQGSRTTPAVASTSPAPPQPARQQARGSTTAQGAPDVHLDSLSAERPKPGPTDRNLFRFKPKAPPPAPASFSSQPASTGPATMSGPGGTGAGATASVPPITLKFIGVMESPERAQKIAVLTDGRGAPFYGKEGEVVEGRYRILKIGVESIDIAYADGRGRQTIRLTGQ